MKKNSEKDFFENLPYSISKHLREKGLSNEEFEMFLSRITLEDIIALKLEISCNGITRGKFFGMPLYHCLKPLIKDAILKFACSMARTRAEAASFLGVSSRYLTFTINHRKESRKYYEENGMTEEEEG